MKFEKIDKMRLCPDAAKKGRENIKKRDTREVVVAILLSSAIFASEGIVVASTNVRVIKNSSTKKPIIRIVTYPELDEMNNPGISLTSYELEKITNNNVLKRTKK